MQTNYNTNKHIFWGITSEFYNCAKVDIWSIFKACFKCACALSQLTVASLQTPHLTTCWWILPSTLMSDWHTLQLMTGALPLSGDVRGEYGGGFSPSNMGGWVELGNGGKPKKGEIVIPVCTFIRLGCDTIRKKICHYFSLRDILFFFFFNFFSSSVSLRLNAWNVSFIQYTCNVWITVSSVQHRYWKYWLMKLSKRLKFHLPHKS